MSMITAPCIGALLAAAALTACSSGSDPAPPAFNATGHWMTWLGDPSTMEEQGPFGSYMSQNGATVDGVGVTGTVSGNNLSMSVDLGLFVLTFNGTMSGNEITGTYMLSGFPVSADFRMQPFVPAGMFTATGTVGGIPVAVNTTSGFGVRTFDDVGLTNLTGVSVTDDDGAMRFEIDFPQPASLTVGMIDASVVPVVVDVTEDGGGATVTATSGTVTITMYDANGFAATFNLMLPLGESVNGSFDVAFDLEAYEPP